MRHSITLCVCTLSMLPVAAGVRAQPADVKRVLRTFDFEERRLGNSEELPMHWDKVEGPGLPHYVNGRLATDSPRGGRYSFRFDLNGGGLIYRYGHGHLKVQPGAHYRVEGFCRTTVLPNARARLSAYFTDVDGHPLRDTIRHSDPYAASSPREGWKKLGVDLSADTPDAAWLVIELQLLQPSHFAGQSLGSRTLHTQDIRGTAWFDDVTVAQVPRVSVRTDRPGNIFARGEPLRLRVVVNDRFTDDLSAQVVVRDATNRIVYQRTEAPRMSSPLDRPAPSAGTPGEGRGEGPNQRKPITLQSSRTLRTTTIDLPDLPPGWYEASLSMSSQGQFVGGQTLSLIHLADGDSTSRAAATRPSAAPDDRFGVIATDLPPEGWERLPEILPLLSAGRVKLALWSKAGDMGQMDPAKFDKLVERLESLGIRPTAVLADPPPTLAAKLEGGDWAGLLKAKPEDWQPQLAYLVSRHANHLDRWQLGADGSDAFATRPEMRQVYAQVYRQFESLVRKPDLAMPWPAWYELEANRAPGSYGPGDTPATVALSVPTNVLPSQVPLYVQDLRGQKGRELSLNFQLLQREKYGREVQIRDLAERVIYALSAGASRIDLPLPFNVRVEADGQVVEEPQELLMIIRTLTSTLGGATFRGKVPLADNVQAFLFDRDGQGVLAVWDDGGGEEPRQLALNLGERPVSVDLWGNVTPLYCSNQERKDGKVRLTLGPMPTFLVDVDGEMSRLRASVALDRPLLESSFEPHARKFRFVNPYRQTVGGMVKLKAPPGWTLSPPTFNFTLNPGETFERDLRIEFPYSSFAGAKTINAEFVLQADGSQTFEVPVALSLGLSDVGMQTMALRDGDDVVVQQMISNYGEKPVDYSAFAIYPGQARQERLVTNLAPGRTTVKKYRFKGAARDGGGKVRVGLKEMAGTRVLNDEVEIR